jgi:hypothetical protein
VRFQEVYHTLLEVLAEFCDMLHVHAMMIWCHLWHVMTAEQSSLRRTHAFAKLSQFVLTCVIRLMICKLAVLRHVACSDAMPSRLHVMTAEQGRLAGLCLISGYGRSPSLSSALVACLIQFFWAAFA